MSLKVIRRRGYITENLIGVGRAIAPLCGRSEAMPSSRGVRLLRICGEAWLAYASDRTRRPSMQRSRRHILRLAAGAAAVPIAPRIAKAQAYPARPVRIVVPTAPAVGRRYPRCGCSANGSRSGSASPSSSRTVRAPAPMSAPRRSSRSRPDGYTLFIVDSDAAINATLSTSSTSISSATPRRSRAWSACASVMQVNPSLPVQERSRVHRLRQGQSGQDRMGSGGIRQPAHVSGEYFKMMTGSDSRMSPIVARPRR